MKHPWWILLLVCAVSLSVPSAQARVTNFDDLDTTAGDLPIDPLSPYQGFSWTNLTAYQAVSGFPGFSNGIVSAGNAAYGGADDVNGVGLVSSLQSATAFDFASAFVGAGYYDNLSVTFEGSRNGSVVFAKTVMANTQAPTNAVFNFSSIDTLSIFSFSTAATSDPFACGTANCAFFTLDDILVNAVAPPPPPPVSAPPTVWLLLLGAAVWLARQRRARAILGWSFAIGVISLVATLTSTSTLAKDPLASQADATRIVPGLEEPLVPAGSTSKQEDAALDAALQAFRSPSKAPEDFADSAKPFVEFLNAYPHSNWRLAILTNLGLGYYRSGYFTTATEMWRRAWEAGRNATEPQPKALADRAVGELARMHARIGHSEALENIFADIGDRQVSGPATEMITGAREALWMFRNEPGTSYLCGPMALKTLLISLHSDADKIAALDEERSGRQGYSLKQVSDLAKKSGLEHRLIYRKVGEAVPIPSIINWKLNHYAAIVGEEDGLYHIQDPTFASGDLWVTTAAIDSEASGYFLVPLRAQSITAWRDANEDEIHRVYGMGFTGDNQAGATKESDHSLTCPSNRRMCAVNAKTMVVSLSLSDTPVGYQPPKGPSTNIRLTYNQREANQPAVFGFFNASPKWSLNVLSWVQDDPAPNRHGRSVLRYVLGGGSINYASGYTYSASTGAFTPERQGQAVLVRIPATGALTSYELRMPDGSKQVFAQLDGATVAPRRVFLTQVIDPAGNALKFNYDAQLRLTSITDATGRNTTFSYGLSAAPLRVTRITDPFGRHADLTYDSAGRLASITDVIGITSSFAYDGSGLINAMATPYGTHRFVYGQDTTSNFRTRFLEMTDPLGFTERLEFGHFATGIASAERLATIGIGAQNSFLQYRNTFYWDKHVYPITHSDYTQAHITHWLHDSANQTSPIIESVKPPLESRIWNVYPGQGATYREGATGRFINRPAGTARVLEDGTTQAIKFTYNAIGKPLTATDPLGRKTLFTYDSSGIDLMTVQQQTSTSGATTTLASFTYNSQHLPLSSTDPAGQVTRYGYNAAGQLTSVTDALGRITRYAHDGLGRLISVIDANNAIQQTLTYDAFDRVATRTDSEGYTLAYGYDALDRVTQVTYPDGTTTRYGYDKLDRVSMTDRLGRTTTYAYDANRRLTAVTDPLGQTTRYGYYDNGVLKSITDPKGNVTQWDIDIQSRVTAKRYSDGTKVTTTYESTTSRVKAVTDALNQTKQHAYANDDRLLSISYVNALNPTPKVSFTYDGFFPRVSSMTDGSGTTQYGYHPAGVLGALQLGREDGPFANDDINYQYDALGRVNNRNVAGSAESWSYDAIGRVSSHTSDLGAFTLGYLGATNQLTRQRSATVGTDWAYEGNMNDRRLKSIENGGIARDYQFTTTPETLIHGIVESVNGVTPKTWTFSYDATNRLKGAQASNGSTYGYSYDPADNIVGITSPTGNRTVAVNGVNQINSVNAVPFTYDANGNLTADDVRTYQWDAENRLVSIRYRANLAKETAFRYDGHDRRIAIVEKNGATSTETRYQWCGTTLCQARDSVDRVTRRYLEEGEVRPITGAKLYYTTDQIGSVRDALDVGSGSKIASYDYDPYGNTTQSTGRGSTDFRYAGMIQHQESGLYLTYYRAYDPRTSRWLSRDPVEEIGGLNLYGYVGGSPVSAVDLDGLFEARMTDSGGRDGPTYGGGLQVAGDNGMTVTVPASSYPNPTNASPGVAEGTYDSVYGDKAHKRQHPGIRLRNGDPVPTLGPNPNNHNQSTATGVNIHCGSRADRRGSAGCITIHPNYCQQVWDILSEGETGKVTIERPID